MITFHPRCDSRPNRFGMFRIYIRITENRVSKLVGTEIYIPSKNLFSTKAKHGKWVSSTVANSKELNEQIISELDKWNNQNIEVHHQKQLYDTLKDKFIDGHQNILLRYEQYCSVANASDNRKMLQIIETYERAILHIKRAYENIDNFQPPHGAMKIHKIVVEFSELFESISFSEKQISDYFELNFNKENLVVFKNFVHYYMSQKEAMNISLGFIRHSRSKANQFLSWHGDETLTFDKIDRKMLIKYVEFLVQKTKSDGEKLKSNSVIDSIQRLSMIFEAAVDEGIIQSNPARHIPLPERNDVIRHRLSDDKIERIENLQIEPTDRYLWLAQKMFLFSYYNAGIRIGDCINLRFCNIINERLEYSMSKTKRSKSVKLSAKSLAIIKEMKSHFYTDQKDYIFNLLDKTKKYFHAVDVEDRRKMDIELKKIHQGDQDTSATLIQRSLKTIAQMIEHDGVLTFHISRHSFADRARRKMKESNGKITIYDIKNALGHTKIETTERYMATFDYDSQDEAMKAVFD